MIARWNWTEYSLDIDISFLNHQKTEFSAPHVYIYEFRQPNLLLIEFTGQSLKISNSLACCQLHGSLRWSKGKTRSLVSANPLLPVWEMETMTLSHEFESEEGTKYVQNRTISFHLALTKSASYNERNSD